MANLYVGIDGGGTKTKCVVSFENGKVIGAGVSGPSNPNYYGFEETLKNVFASIRKACLKGRFISRRESEIKLKNVCLGLSGVRRKNQDKLMNMLSAMKENGFNSDGVIIKWDKIAVYGDHLISWYGAFEGQTGIVTIAGTGHIAYGRKENLEADSVGISPKSFLKGGGFPIGLWGIRVALRKMRIKDNDDILLLKLCTAFENGMLWKNLRRIELKLLLEDALRVFRGKKMKFLKRKDIAAVAFFVDEAAREGHRFSNVILNATGSRIARNVDFVRSQLPFREDEVVNLAVIGSVFRSLKVKHQMKKRLGIEHGDENKLYRILPPLHPPEIGALLMAIKNIEYVVS